MRLVGTPTPAHSGPCKHPGLCSGQGAWGGWARWYGSIVPFLVIVLLWQIKLNQKVSALQEARGWQSWLQLTRAKEADQ